MEVRMELEGPMFLRRQKIHHMSAVQFLNLSSQRQLDRVVAINSGLLVVALVVSVNFIERYI